MTEYSYNQQSTKFIPGTWPQGVAMLRAAFDRGGKITIDIINKSSLTTYSDIKIVRALQEYVTKHVAPVWGTPARLNKSLDYHKDAWALIFVDDQDSLQQTGLENVLGYHGVTPYGLPLSIVFVKSSLAAKEDPMVTASHEIVEMLVDPAVNLWAENPDGTLWAWETADAVERTYLKVRGITMSNFVYPAFFEGFRKPNSAKFDHLGLVKKPFSLLAGGYSLVWSYGEITPVFGSKRAEKAFYKEDRRGHRSEFRYERLKRSRRNVGANLMSS